MTLGTTLSSHDVRARRTAAPVGAICPRGERIHTRGYLPPRLRELETLLVRGLSQKRCAEEMGLSKGTVKVMSSDIYFRIGVAGRDELQYLWMSRHISQWALRHAARVPKDALDELVSVLHKGPEFGDRWLA